MNLKDKLKQYIIDSEILICPICKSKNHSYYNDLCDNCKKSLTYAPKDGCNGCGGEHDTVLAICSKCLREKKRHFISATTLFKYDKYSREAVLLFKFNKRVELARFFSNLAYERLIEKNWDIDIIVPIPLHWTRRIQRGFNQSEIFANLISKKAKIPLKSKALKRIRKTRDQKKLNSVERHKNLRNTFRANPKYVKDKRILLVDDIFTTGATVDNASIELMNAGALCVYVMTITRA